MIAIIGGGAIHRSHNSIPAISARHLPGTVGIAQIFAVGIRDQFIADPGIKKISRHTFIQWGRTH